MNPEHPYQLSVIIPAFNEGKRIGPTLEKVAGFLDNQPYSSEVIVVDDGSRDNTFSVVNDFIEGRENYQLFKFGKNKGKGAAVKRGMMAAQGQFRLFMDADFSTPIEEVNKLFDWIKLDSHQPDRHDVVIGSRRVKGAKILKRQPIFREASGRVFSLLVRSLAFPGFLDTQCGFKLFTAEAAQKIFPLQTINRFGFDVEILFVAVRILGLRVKEAPVTWTDSPQTTVRLSKDAMAMFGDLLRIRALHAAGRYSA